MTEITRDDIRNGWTPESLEAYHLAREEARGLVPGNVVTQFMRPKRIDPDVEPVASFNPHKWNCRR